MTASAASRKSGARRMTFIFRAMQSTEESDVYQERLDRATRSYIGDNQFYPFAERYPEIRQLGYGPRRTK